jgi:hypothetical protein
MRWLGTAAAPAPQAAPTNDPSLAGRELLNRGLPGGLARCRRSPARLARLNLGLSFDPALQPRYALREDRPCHWSDNGL